MPKTLYKPRPALSLTEAVEQLMVALGGMKAASELPGCRVARSTLFKYTDPNAEKECAIPADIAAYFESVSGIAPITAWMAAQSGHVLVALPDAKPLDLPHLLAGLGKESGELFAEIGRALSDQKISRGEAVRLVKELRDLVAVAAGGLVQLEAMLEGDAK